MKKGMNITYEVGSGLYVNLTNRCTNRCEFCIRNNGDGAYGSESLWLEREPTVKEALDSIFSRDLKKYTELVFCGYGEPTYRLSDAVYIAKEVRKSAPELTIRINTNGHSDLILGCDTAGMYEGAFDCVSISLNTPNKQKYAEICHPVYKEEAYPALLCFAKNVKNYVPFVAFSVVRETLLDSELEECRKIAEEAGVTLKVRDYISG